MSWRFVVLRSLLQWLAPDLNSREAAAEDPLHDFLALHNALSVLLVHTLLPLTELP